MAGNLKEYEMLFQLNAQLGSSYSSTFTKAQQQILSMQTEIQSLSKMQTDITAYQKQQAAVEATREKLSVLQQQYDNIQKEIQETEGFSSDLENRLLSKQQQIDKTSASLERQTEKLNQMDTALKDAGIDTGNLSQESAKLGEEINDLKEQQEQATAGAKSFGETSAQAFGAIQTAIAAAGVAAALKEIYDAYMECVDIAADFESSMSNVEALSGATAEEMEQLTAKAKELGATTVYTAQEASDAMGYMAMAGWDASEMMAGMNGVLQLAAASSEDLAQVSDIVTDNLTAFGLTAADTAHFSDVLAAAATNSNTSVSIMGETFKNSASIAGALGYSIDDVAVAVGLMANSGIKGSLAGTALKNTFNGLLEGVTLTSSAFGEYEFSAIQADGTMKSFSATIQELRSCFDQMTEAERVSNAMAIAGSRSYNGLLAIINATDADYQSLTESIQNCSGAAQTMANIKLDNLKGQVTLMNSALDAVKTTLGEQYNDELRALYEVQTDVLTKVNEFIQTHPGVVKGIMAEVAVIGTVTAGITTYTAIMKAAIPVIKLFGAAVTGAIPGVGTILAVTAAVAALAAVVVGMSEATDAEAEAVRGMTEASRADYYQLQDLKSEYEDACEIYGETSDQAMYLAWQIDELNASFEGSKQSLSEYVEECNAVHNSLNQTLDANSNTLNEISANEGMTLALVHRLQELASQTDKTVETQEEMKAIIAELNETVPDLAISYEDVISGVTDYGAAIEAAVKSQAALQKYEAAQQGMVDAYNAQYTARQQLEDATSQQESAQERLNAAEQEYLEYLSTVTKYDTTGFGSITARFSDEYKEYQEALEAIKTYDDQAVQAQKDLDKATSKYEEYLNELKSYIEGIENAAATSKELNTTIADVMTQVEALAAAYTEAYNAALESVQGQYALWDEAAEVVATSADTINTALDSQVTYWQNYNTNLQALNERSKDIEGLSDMIASFADGSTDSVNAVAGMATATDEELAAMVEDWQTLQAEQKKVADSIAELNENFSAEMDAMAAALAEDIEAMNLSEEAAASGKSTIEGFVTGANDMLPQVQAAYASIAQAAMNAIDSTLDIHSPSREMEWRAEMTWAGYINQTKAMEPDVAAAMSEAVNLGARAVELQAIGGSLTAATTQTEAVVTGESTSLPPIHVTVNVEGNASADTAEDLKNVAGELVEAVLEAIDDREHDRQRTRYR